MSKSKEHETLTRDKNKALTQAVDLQVPISLRTPSRDLFVAFPDGSYVTERDVFDSIEGQEKATRYHKVIGPESGRAHDWAELRKKIFVRSGAEFANRINTAGLTSGEKTAYMDAYEYGRDAAPSKTSQQLEIESLLGDLENVSVNSTVGPYPLIRVQGFHDGLAGKDNPGAPSTLSWADGHLQYMKGFRVGCYFRLAETKAKQSNSCELCETRQELEKLRGVTS